MRARVRADESASTLIGQHFLAKAERANGPLFVCKWSRGYGIKTPALRYKLRHSVAIVRGLFDATKYHRTILVMHVSATVYGWFLQARLTVRPIGTFGKESGEEPLGSRLFDSVQTSNRPKNTLTGFRKPGTFDMSNCSLYGQWI